MELAVWGKHEGYVCVLLQLTVLEEEVHGEIPVGDNHPKGAGQLDRKRVHYSKRRPGEHSHSNLTGFTCLEAELKNNVTCLL